PRGGCSCCRRLLSVACTGPHRHIHSFPTRRSSDLLRDEPLDLFVLFSSLSATLGNAGQADYCAAGAFQDGYAILRERLREHGARDRKSTRLNSSHASISYAVACLREKDNSVGDLRP